MAENDERKYVTDAVHPEPPARGSGRHPVRSLLVVIFVAAVTLATAEQLARRFAPPSPREELEMFILDANVGWRFLPNHTYPSLDDWFGRPLDLPFHTNNRGLRGTRDYPAPRGPNEFRVLCIGDSTVNMAYFDGFPEFMEEILAEALPDFDIWVQNAGINGFSSLNAMYLAREEIPRFRPDVVIYTVGTDDAMLTDKPARREFEVRSFTDMILRVGQHSRLVTWTRRTVPRVLVQPVGARTEGAEHIPREQLITRTEPDEAREYYTRMVQIARRHDAYPILTLQPWLFWNLNDFDPGAVHVPLTPWTQRIWEAAQETGAALMDAIELFDRPDRAWFFMMHPPKVPDDPWGMKVDPIHLNMAGNELLAAAYAAKILDRVAAEQPDVTINREPIRSIFERYEQPPEFDPTMVRGIPSPEYAEHLMRLDAELNAGRDWKPWENE